MRERVTRMLTHRGTGYVRTQQEGGHLQAQEKPDLHQHLDLRLPVFRSMKINSYS